MSKALTISIGTSSSSTVLNTTCVLYHACAEGVPPHVIYAIPDTTPQTRAASARQLTTGHRHAVPTRESQSDESSLPTRRPPGPSATAMTQKPRQPEAPLDTRVHLRSVGRYRRRCRPYRPDG